LPDQKKKDNIVKKDDMKAKKLTQKPAKRLYQFNRGIKVAILGTTSPCSDPTTMCGTIFTTTHLMP